MQHLFGFGSSLHAQRKEEDVRWSKVNRSECPSKWNVHTYTYHTNPLSLSHTLSLFIIWKRVSERPTESTWMCVLLEFQMEYSQLHKYSCPSWSLEITQSYPEFRHTLTQHGFNLFFNTFNTRCCAMMFLKIGFASSLPIKPTNNFGLTIMFT